MIHDIAVLGAGAAGLYCAAIAAQRGASVVLLDHAPKLAEKIRISGGGRCNFTNVGTTHERFHSRDPAFARAALKAHGAKDFVSLVRRHRIGFHEKHRGQLFCDRSAEDIIDMLVAECDAGGVQWLRPVTIHETGREGETFTVGTSGGTVRARRLVVATGGLSIPKIGATDIGYRIARQFGVPVTDTRPALVPLTFDPGVWSPFSALSGLSLEAAVQVGEGKGAVRFDEDLLLTHRGLSGPAVLQISTFWDPGQPLRVDLAPGADLEAALLAGKEGTPRTLANVLATVLPRSLAQGWLQADAPVAPVAAGSKPPTGELPFALLADRRIAEVSNKRLRELARGLSQWTLLPSGTEGYRKAEVTRGGVDTRALDPRSMEARAVPGLHFIGEVVDMTGWLGGYNFQWAWSSAWACAQAATA